MLKASLRKIKSAPNTASKLIAGGVILLLVVWMVVLAVGLRSDAPQADYLLQTKNQTYSLEAVQTPEDQEKGLSNRDGMPENSGMIFVYSEEKERCFWMKDMRFPLDIIWVDGDRRITFVEKNLTPATYPNLFCHNAQYVIELNGGEAAKNDLTTGKRLDF